MKGEGLVHGKKCTVLMASGGVYTEGSPIPDRDIATQYLRLILKEQLTVKLSPEVRALLHANTDGAAPLLARQLQTLHHHFDNLLLV